MMLSSTPTIIDLDMERLDAVLRRAETALDEEDYATLKAVVESYAYLAELVGDKNTTIRRLRKLLFGARTEKTSTAVGGKKGRTGSQPPSSQDPAAPPESSPKPTGNPARKPSRKKAPGRTPRRPARPRATAATGPAGGIGRRLRRGLR